MNAPATMKSIFATAAGPRLRCFLGRSALFFALAQCFCAIADASICVGSRVYVIGVHGVVVDTHEKEIPGALVTISTNAGIIAQAKTDETGHFHIKAPHGVYGVQVHASGYQDGTAELRVGLGLKSIFHTGILFFPLTTALGYCDMQPTTNHRLLKVETDYWREVFEPQVKRP
jgi:hypothetical protein